ncbi:MAG: hypothetical protein ACOC33_01970 [bacterium]
MTKLVHEKMMEKYDIDLESFKNEKPLKFLTKEMIQDIIKLNINNIGKYTELKENDKMRTITVEFETIEDSNLFEKIFNTKLFEAMNSYLESNGLNPSDYKRMISVSISGDNTTKNITY